MAPISAAIHAEGWRGYLLASEDKFEEAMGAVRNLKGLMERMQDERFPIGMAIAARAQDRLSRILLRLTQRDISAEQFDHLIASAKTIPTLDFKASFAKSLSTALHDIDGWEDGKYDIEPPFQILGVRISLGRTRAYYDAIRRDVLEDALSLYDNWATAKVDMITVNSLDLSDLDIGQEILATYVMVGAGQLQSDRNHIANRRALLLTLAARKHVNVTGKLPTTAELERQGFDATDPWGGEKMTLHEDGERIWVGGLRKNRQALQPAPLQTMEILEWRP
jgi:hypothetical protein